MDLTDIKKGLEDLSAGIRKDRALRVVQKAIGSGELGEDVLIKAKYLKREKKGGKWVYTYPDKLSDKSKKQKLEENNLKNKNDQELTALKKDLVMKRVTGKNTPEEGELLKVVMTEIANREKDKIEQLSPLKKILNKVESDILKHNGNKFESLSALDSNGKELFRLDGDKSSVAIPSNKVNQLMGATITHNHPNSSGLSSADMYLTMNKGIKEMRAIAPDSIYGKGTYVFKNNFEGHVPTVVFNRIVGQVKENGGVVRDKFENFVDESKLPWDKKVKFANSLDNVAKFMKSEMFQFHEKKGNFEIYFEKENGEKVDIKPTLEIMGLNF